MSDSEDDFMSDKFLVDAPTTSGHSTYSDRRNISTLKSMRKGQANNQLSHKQQEEKNRREGLSTSLFDTAKKDESRDGGGGTKAMEFMKKMGWNVGEGLGRKRSESPPPAKRQRQGEVQDEGDDEEDEVPRGGLGSRGRTRVEPLRISLWSGRKGLSARDPSPPPLPKTRNPDELDPRRMEQLGKKTDDFRTRQRREFEVREVEKKESKARELLVKFDEEQGVTFHPLHVLPFDPLGTLPKPLLRIIYPSQAGTFSPGPSRSPTPPPELVQRAPERERLVSAAEKVREQMRKDMLSSLAGGDEEDIRFGIPAAKDDKPKEDTAGDKARQEDPKQEEGKEVDWPSMVSGTKRVLSMTSAEHLRYLLSQLRHEHKYCFWCSFKYKSYDEMDGPGGCPGEEEDDH